MRVLFHSYAFVDPMDRAVGIVFLCCPFVCVYVHGQRHSQTDLPSTSSLLFVGTAAQKLGGLLWKSGNGPETVDEMLKAMRDILQDR